MFTDTINKCAANAARIVRLVKRAAITAASEPR